MKICQDCGLANAHHPNCPSYDERDFVEEPDCFDAYREQKEREDRDVCYP